MASATRLPGFDSTGDLHLLPVGIFLHQYPSLDAQEIWTFADRFAKLSRHVLGEKKPDQRRTHDLMAVTMFVLMG